MQKTQEQSDNSRLNRDFTLPGMFAFSFPIMVGMLVTALFSIGDGFFINLYVGDIAMSAINLFYPMLSILLASGIMLGTGGNAIMVREIGANNPQKSNKVFSQIVEVAIGFSLVYEILALVFKNPILNLLGATEITTPFLNNYYIPLILISPAVLLQGVMGIFLVGEGKQMLAAILALLAGVLNLFLDFLFMGPLDMGIVGASIATAIGYVVSTILMLIYYFGKHSIYRFHITKLEWSSIWETLFNGSSEMVTNLSTGVTTLIMNHLAIGLYGENGVSVLTVVMYIQFLMMALFMGFSEAIGPVFSFHYGSGNVPMRKKIFKMSFQLIAILTVVVAILFIFFDYLFIGIFFPQGSDLFELSKFGMMMILTSCPFFGVNVFASGLFTAFSNGKISALLSTLRTLVLLIVALYSLTFLFGEIGFWLATTVAEALTFIFSVYFMAKYRKVYEW